MKIYKYVGPKRVDILENGCIHFTRLGQLNDVFEGRPYVSAITDSPETIDQAAEEALSGDHTKPLRDKYNQFPHSVREVISFQDFHQSMDTFFKGKGREIAVKKVTENSRFEGGRLTREEFQDGIVHHLDERYGVLSLAKDGNNALMWSHYTDEHRGMVIEFDSCSSFFTEPDEASSVLNVIHEVTYNRKRPKVNWKPAQMDDTAYEDHLLQSFFLLKSDVWSYEREWRVVRRFPDADNLEGTRPTPQGYLFNITPDCITGVIIGCRADEALLDKLRNLKTQSRYEHLRLRKAMLDEDEYALYSGELQ